MDQNSSAIQLRGEDVETALREWVKSEVKDGPKLTYDLGKFFFTVSIGTIGAFATIEKLNSSPAMDSSLLWSFGMLALSVIAALEMARPRVYIFDSGTDLLTEYERQIRLAQRRIWVWFTVWVIGIVIGAWAVRS